MAVFRVASVSRIGGAAWQIKGIFLLQVFLVTLTAGLSPDHQFYEIFEALPCGGKSKHAFGWIKSENYPEFYPPGTSCRYEINPSVRIRFTCKTFNLPTSKDGICTASMMFEEEGQWSQACGNRDPGGVFQQGVTITFVSTDETEFKLSALRNKGKSGGKYKKKRISFPGRGGRRENKPRKIKSGSKIRGSGKLKFGTRNKQASRDDHKTRPSKRKGIPRNGARTKKSENSLRRREVGGDKSVTGKLMRSLRSVSSGSQRGKKNDRKGRKRAKLAKKDDIETNAAGADDQGVKYGYFCAWQPEDLWAYFYNYYYYYPWYSYGEANYYHDYDQLYYD